jgi:hypothetical protein
MDAIEAHFAQKYDKEWETRWINMILSKMTIEDACKKYGICANQNFTVEMMERWIEFANLYCACDNPNLTLDFIAKHVNIFKRDIYQELCKNSVITCDAFLHSPIPFIRLWENFSYNPNVSVEFALQHKDKSWDWTGISRKPITIKQILENPDVTWNYYGISSNSSITMDMITSNPEFPWKWFCVAYNPNITMEFVLDNIEKFQNEFHALSANNGITIQDVINNPRFNWNWYCVSQKPSVTFEIVLKNPNYEWDYSAVCCNMYVTIEQIQQHPEFPWDWNKLMRNNRIPLTDLLNYMNANGMNPNKFMYELFECRKDLTLDIVEHLEIGNGYLYDLVKYKFEHDRTTYVKNNTQRMMKWICLATIHETNEIEFQYKNKNNMPIVPSNVELVLHDPYLFNLVSRY